MLLAAPAPQPAQVSQPAAVPAERADVPQPDAVQRPEAAAVSVSEPAHTVSDAPALQGNAVASPDPEREEQPKVRRTRASKAGAPALSIKSLTEEQKIVAETPVTINASVELSEPEIRQKWQELAALYASKPRLANTIGSAGLEVQDDNGVKVVVFSVFNTAQKDWIEEKCLHELEGNFQKLTSSHIKLMVSVAPEEDKAPVAYMPSEKARDLMEKNEEVKNLVTDLGLDVK